MKITYKGSAKPDDPIYRMGLVVSGQTFKPSPKSTAPKPEAKPLPLHPKSKNK